MSVSAVLIHSEGLSLPGADESAIVLSGSTLMLPVAETFPQPPVSVTVYKYVPVTEGVPVIVTEFAAQLPDTPAGSPENVAPLAPVVA